MTTLRKAAIAAMLMASGPTAAQSTPAQEQALKKFAAAVPHFTRSERIITANGRRYKIFMSVPRGKPPAAGYPVLYVTDANGTFGIAAQTAENDASFADYSRVDPAIVVGIGYDSDLAFPPMRAFDLSPPDPRSPADSEVMLHESIMGTGGADQLLDMIEKRVKPMVATAAPVDPQRQALFGHSRGGLFVVYTLFTRPEMFQTYIAASPAIWWHDRFVLSKQAMFARRAERGEVKARLLIAVGSLEGKGETTPPDPKAANMVGNARRLDEALNALKAPGLSVQYRSFEDEDHMSVIPAALSAAVRFALRRPG